MAAAENSVSSLMEWGLLYFPGCSRKICIFLAAANNLSLP
jgi:hypothetical protein